MSGLRTAPPRYSSLGTPSVDSSSSAEELSLSPDSLLGPSPPSGLLLASESVPLVSCPRTSSGGGSFVRFLVLEPDLVGLGFSGSPGFGAGFVGSVGVPEIRLLFLGGCV